MLRRYNFYVIPRGCSDFFYAFCFWYCFTPLSGYFSPFPHGTGPLSVIREYLGLSGGPDRFTRDFSGPVLLGILSRRCTALRLRGSHPLRPAFQDRSPIPALTPHQSGRTGTESPTTPTMQRDRKS